MSLYHLSAQIISRSNGQSACAAAAYRSGEKITNDYDGITRDYRRKQNVEHSVVMLPESAPADFADRVTLWNSVEQNEKQVNAQLAREIEFSLPRELPPEIRERIAIEFVQEHLVQEGMIVDVNFHNPPKMNSKKQPIDAEGNVTKDPEKFIYENPHCHAMSPLRPVDESGKWEAKRQKIYVCEKDGQEGRFTAEQLKQNQGWEKLYNYTDSDGKKSWHTKSYVDEHPEEGLVLVNRYPKSETAMNPIVEKWNSKDFLLTLREAWAIKVNETFASLGMEERIDHRSYKDQGVDLIPTIHEGKSVTIAEKRLKEEYEQKLSRGESAVLQHTEIRDLNNAIREHNHEIRIIAELKKLRAQMESIIVPVKDRIEAIEQNFAEKLERLRAEIICLTVKIRKAVDLKGKADEQINSNEAYIEDLSPVRKEKIEELQLERKALKKQLDNTAGLFSGKRKDDLTDRIESLDSEISILKENRKYAIDAQKEIKRLRSISNNTGIKIEQMQEQRNERVEEYSSVEATIPQETRKSIQIERLSIRSEIEQDYIEETGALKFRLEADKVDKKMACSVADLSMEPSRNFKKRVIRFSAIE